MTPLVCLRLVANTQLRKGAGRPAAVSAEPIPPSEQERAIKAVALGVLLGSVLAMVSRRRHRA